MAKRGQAIDVSMNKPALSILFSVVFLDNLGFAIVFPYLFFFVQSLGANASVYGLLLASYSIMAFIFTPIIGRISDSHGRRRVLLVALFVSGCSYFIFGMAHVLWLLFAARMLAGTTAATVSVAQAYVADVTAEKIRLKYLGLLGAAAGVAFIVGPAIGGTLSGLYGFALPSFLASAIAFANLVSAYFKLPEPSRVNYDKEKSAFTLSALKNVLRKKAISLLLITYCLFTIAFVFLQVVLPPWLEKIFRFHSLETGLLLFYVGAIVAITQAILLPRLSKKYSNYTLVMFGILALAFGFVVLGVIPNIYSLLLMSGVISFGLGIQIATLTTMISINAPREAQGGTLSLAQSLSGLSQSIAPAIATASFELGSSIGLNGLTFFISGLVALSTIPLVLVLRRTK
jgi:DHA1 family tetracycline resistance protein-like MFS transporter